MRYPMTPPPPGRALIVLAGAVAWTMSCGAPGSPREAPSPAPDTTVTADALAMVPPPDTAVHAGRYRSVEIPSRRALRGLWKELGPERFLLTLKVNRRDSSHVRDGDSLMVPDSTAELLDLSPFPRELPSIRDFVKLILVSRRVQAFAAYETGRLVRWGPTSTGRETLQTLEGLYHTNWKDKERTSTFNEEWLLRWYVNIENFLGISFHLFDLPGYPASHSCIRLLEDDAIWLYEWAEQWKIDPQDPRRILQHGTPVAVFGQFAYGKKSPWRKLAMDSTATNVPLGEIEVPVEKWLKGPVGDSLRTVTAAAPADSATR